MPDTMTPAEIKERRKALRLTQAGLAKALGYTTNTVEKWEAGDVKAPPILWRALRDLEREMASHTPQGGEQEDGR